MTIVPSRTNEGEPGAGRLGVGLSYHWRASADMVDMSMPQPTPVPLPTAPQVMTIDLLRTANLGIRTVLFADVNTDQCVLHSLTDANFLGYGCILVEDCCATTSPAFCTEATVWNVKKCFGFVTGSKAILNGLAGLSR